MGAVWADFQGSIGPDKHLVHVQWQRHSHQFAEITELYLAMREWVTETEGLEGRFQINILYRPTQLDGIFNDSNTALQFKLRWC